MDGTRATLVTCEGLVKIYKVPEADVEVVALQGLDLEVPRGEFLALVGQSGSGKSTLLNILGALDLPSAGRCAVDGHSLTHLAERARNNYRRYVVGHVWQQSGRNLVPDLSLADNVALPQVLAGVGRAERGRRSQELLEQVGLGEQMNRHPAQVSGGEQQRAAIAVALANEPALLLADEPTGELDSATASEVVALLRALNRALELTIVLVTHDPAVASQADRMIAIRDGRTSTETLRRVPSREPVALGAVSSRTGGTVMGLPSSLYAQVVVIDRVGQLQLPAEALARIPFAGRAELRLATGRMELWPVGMGET
jgi:ABC-type lipoprotein export system ATPase subunit